MKPTIKNMVVILGIATCGLQFSCKTEKALSPSQELPESVQIKELKSYFAKTVAVDVSNVNYNALTDEFSVNNTSKVPRLTLLKFYDISKLNQKNNLNSK